MLLHINGKFKVGKTIFSRIVSFLTGPHCQFPGIGRGIKHNMLYLWNLLFQLNMIDAINKITKFSVRFGSQLSVYDEGNLST